jgi:hypothetical protein
MENERKDEDGEETSGRTMFPGNDGMKGNETLGTES